MLAIDILEWPGMNVAFLASFFGAIALTLLVIPYGKRRPVGKPLSWGEAMLASIYAFGVMFLAFGVAPHQWIDHADKNLGWSKDKIIYGPGGILKPQSAGGWNPITLQYEAAARHRRRPHPRRLLRADHLHLELVAEARPGPVHRDRHELLRPAAGEEGLEETPP